MKSLIDSLFIAVSMYSSVPVPYAEWNDRNMRNAMCFFPLVGAFCGAALIALWKICILININPMLFGAFAVLANVIITGGIHIDGFCDTSDALLSRRPQEEKLKILKDSGYKIHLDLIGSGPKNREDELKALARTREIEENINFCGWKSQDEVFAAMDDSDIFVYPSAVESTGLGVMEAMARGMYIACSKMSCMPDVLKNFGVYFDPELEQGIANAVEMLIKSPCVCGEIASEGAEYAKRYTWENAVKGHCEFFEELRSNRRKKCQM